MIELRTAKLSGFSPIQAAADRSDALVVVEIGHVADDAHAVQRNDGVAVGVDPAAEAQRPVAGDRRVHDRHRERVGPDLDAATVRGGEVARDRRTADLQRVLAVVLDAAAVVPGAVAADRCLLDHHGSGAREPHRASGTIRAVARQPAADDRDRAVEAAPNGAGRAFRLVVRQRRANDPQRRAVAEIDRAADSLGLVAGEPAALDDKPGCRLNRAAGALIPLRVAAGELQLRDRERRSGENREQLVVEVHVSLDRGLASARVHDRQRVVGDVEVAGQPPSSGRRRLVRDRQACTGACGSAARPCRLPARSFAASTASRSEQSLRLAVAGAGSPSA